MSRITAHSLWVALSIGLPLMAAIWHFAPVMVAAMGATAEVSRRV